jgi:predicted 3-demethylubiquinone-9 3-methyltransferase (glyoxalase superfamily)
MTSIAPSLWFDDEAEEAAAHYVAVFGGRVLSTELNMTETPSKKPVGSVVTVEFELFGTTFTALNGGPGVEYTDALSIQVLCDDQQESDRYWNGILEGGGEPQACGWIRDRFGARWQIYPKELIELTTDPDPERARRASDAMLRQVRIDLEEIRAAMDGATS